MVSKNAIRAEINRRKQHGDHTEILKHADLLEEKKQELESIKHELDVTNDKLKTATEALYDRNAELNLRKQSFESANRAIYNDLAAEEKRVAAKLNRLEQLRSMNKELETEISMINTDMSDRVRTFVSEITSALDTERKSISKTLIANDKIELNTILQMNPGCLAVIEDVDGELHFVDNRNLAVQLVNDTASTESSGAVTPFKFFKPLTPVSSSRGGTITTLDSLSESLSNYSRWGEQVTKGVLIEPMYGGVRLQIHKVGPRVTIWDSERIDVTETLPTIKEAAEFVPHNYVIDGFLEVNAGRALRKSEIKGMILNNDSTLESKSRFIVTDILWMDGKDCHTEVYESRLGKLTAFNDRHRNIVASKHVKVYNKHDCVTCIEQMARTPNAMGAVMKHPDYAYNLSGSTTMAMEFAMRKTLNVKILYSSSVNQDLTEFIYDCAVLDENGNEIYVGKTNITDIQPDSQALRVEFSKIAEFIDPNTDLPHFNMIGAKVLDAVGLDEVSSIETAKRYADMDDLTVRFRALPEFGLIFSSMDMPPLEEIETDCACSKQPARNEEQPTIDVEFKVKEQTYTIVNDGQERTKSEYHLLIQLPTKILDFVSTLNPLNQQQCTMERSTATKMHWDVSGELSQRHKLNDKKSKKSTISTIDQGQARLTMEDDLNYSMKMYMKGEFMDGNFELHRQNYSTEAWMLSQTTGVN